MDRFRTGDKFECCDCHENIDDSRLVKSPFDEEICEMCAVKCFICENHFRYKDTIQVNGDNICCECREHLFVVYDSYRRVFLTDCMDNFSSWCGDKSEIRTFDSQIEAQEVIDLFLSGHERYQIQKL